MVVSIKATNEVVLQAHVRIRDLQDSMQQHRRGILGLRNVVQSCLGPQRPNAKISSGDAYAIVRGACRCVEVLLNLVKLLSLERATDVLINLAKSPIVIVINSNERQLNTRKIR